MGIHKLTFGVEGNLKFLLLLFPINAMELSGWKCFSFQVASLQPRVGH